MGEHALLVCLCVHVCWHMCAWRGCMWTVELRKRFSWLLCIFSQSWGNLTISVRRSDNPTDVTGISGLMRCFHGPWWPQWSLAPVLLMQLFSSKKGKNNELLNQTIHCIPVILQLRCLFIRDRSIFHFFNWITLIWLKALSLITCQLQWRPT